MVSIGPNKDLLRMKSQIGQPHQVAVQMPTQLFWHAAPKDYATLNELEQFKSFHGFFWQPDLISNSKYR